MHNDILCANSVLHVFVFVLLAVAPHTHTHVRMAAHEEMQNVAFIQRHN